MPAGAYQGVILAAGSGNRMGALAAYCPKALLPVANRSLLTRHLETLRQLGVTEVFIVIGHLGGQIRDAVGDGRKMGMTVHYVEQPRREGLAHAVGLLEDRISKPFVLLLGDIYFEFSNLHLLLQRFATPWTGGVIAVRDECDPAAVRQNFSVESDASGRVARVVEKPEEPAVLRKGCGLYLFSPAIFDAIRRTPRSPLRGEYELTDAIQVLIDDGVQVYDAPVVDWDLNITTPEDVITCNRHALRQSGLELMQGSDCDLATGTTLAETVLGDGVRILRPCHLDGCVVLPGTVIGAEGTLCGQVLFPGDEVTGQP